MTAEKRVEFFLERALRKQIGGRIVGLHQRIFQLLDIGTLFWRQVLAPKLQARIADAEEGLRSWLAARFAADAGLFNSCASPAESFPRAASRSRCCSMRVTSRIRSDISPTSRFANSGIFCTSSGNPVAGKSKQSTVSKRSPRHRKLLHAGKRQRSRNVARLQRKDKYLAAQFTASLQLPVQHDIHRIRGVALSRVRLAGFKVHLFCHAEKPVKLIIRKIRKLRYFAQFGLVSHLYLAQILMDELHRDRAFSHARGDTFHRTVANIADREDTGNIRFQQERIAFQTPSLRVITVTNQVGTSQNESAFVALDYSQKASRSSATRL